MKYIIKDWAGNVMNWGVFDSLEDAGAELDARVQLELEDSGIYQHKIWQSGLTEEFPELEDILDKIVTTFSGEYIIEELNNE